MKKKSNSIRRGLSNQIDNVIVKILKRAKVSPLGVYEFSTKLAVENGEKVLLIKELKQQIISCRGSMNDIFGLEIISDIDQIPIKVKRVGRPLIFKEMPELEES
jgi:hypothetical protein